MFTSMRIQNFKAWKDTGRVRLAPLTVIFGANSSGKSSLGHLLLALKQTALSADRRRALHLGDVNTLIDLGTFEDCLYGHDPKLPLSFELSWRLQDRIQFDDPLHPDSTYEGDNLSLAVTLIAGKSEQPEATSVRYTLRGKKGDTEVASLDVKLDRASDGKVALTSDDYWFVRTEGRQWPLDGPEKFYRVSDITLARFKNAGFLTDFALQTESMLGRLSYLGPLREHPRRIYLWSGDTPEDVGQKGEYAVSAILAAQAEGRTLNRGRKKRNQPFPEFIANWLKDLGIIHSFVVKPVAKGRKEFEVLLKVRDGSPEVKITDVGFGVSQVLPALVQAFYCSPNSVVWMEQPEIHLHPQVQAELADVFISAIYAREAGQDRNVQLIVESHSEHFLNRLQRRVAEKNIELHDVAIYICKRNDSGAELEPLRVNLYGEIENWPENFFGDEMAELTARTIAAAQRRREESAK